VAALSAARARLPAGWPRLVAVAPLVALNAALPLLFANDGELLSRITVAFVLTWLASFKVRGVVAGRGGAGSRR
jgi:hypothetical protein